MAAYLIAEHKITDANKFEEYRTKVGPLIAKHGGRYLTKGGSHKLPDGGHWEPGEEMALVAAIRLKSCGSSTAVSQTHLGYHRENRGGDEIGID